MESVVYRIADGIEIRADVYNTTGDEPSPAVLFFHAGGLIMGDRSWIAPRLVSAITSAGIAMVSVDYRLAPETKLPLITSDIEAAYDWIRGEAASKFSFDPDRIGVVGGSAGGYLALLAGATFRPSPSAIVSFYGYGNLTGSWYTMPDPHYNTEPAVSEIRARSVVGTLPISQDPSGDRHDFYLYCRQQGSWPQEVCGHYPSDSEWYKAYEPLRNVTTTYPPTMLLHGDSDTDVPFQQSVLMAKQFESHGVSHQFISNPDWDHAFDLTRDEPSIQEAIGSATNFLAKHLGVTR